MSGKNGDVIVAEAALLEWVNSLDDIGPIRSTVKSLRTLDAGDFLLRVLHDVAPNEFAAPESVLVETTLRGLQQYFKKRQSVGGESASYRLLQKFAVGAEPVDTSKLVQLVILASLVNDDPRTLERYLQCYQTRLTSQGQQAIQTIHSGYEEAVEDELDVSDSVRRPSESEGFLTSGQDYESRYRKLKQSCIDAETERERLEEECSCLRKEIDEERRRRKDAEDAETVARMDLKQADMSRDRVKEENRALYEVRLEQQAQAHKQEMKELRGQLESLRDQQASDLSDTQKLQMQLQESRRKLQVQAQRVAELELSVQTSKTGEPASGEAPALEHLRNRVNALQAEASDATRLRAEVITLTQERDKLKTEVREAKNATAQMKVQLSMRGKDGPHANEGVAGGSLIEATAHAGIPGDVLERLLAEKERATRAEEQLKAKREVISTLKEQRKDDSAQIASLNQQVAELRAQAAKGGGSSDSEALREVKSQLAQRERELQVQEYRRSVEVEPLVMQQALMASCFHDMGVKYHKLRLKYERLRRRFANSTDAEETPESGDGGTGAKPSGSSKR